MSFFRGNKHMQRLFHRLKNLAVLLSHLQWKEIGDKIGNRIYSTTHYDGLVKNMSDPADPIVASMPTKLRSLRKEDINILFDVHAPGLSASDISDRLYGHLLCNAGIHTCYVAVTQEGVPCAALWLIASTENTKLGNISNGTFPLLAADEMLLEGLFTLKPFRNMHIMASSIGQVVSKAKASGAAKVIAFVHQSNVQSLRTLSRSGFRKYVVKRERWFLFFRTLTFEAIAPAPDVVHDQKNVGMLKTPETVRSGAMRVRSSYMVNSPE